jgi:tetratricopeptide (TPR) repeat protein
LLQNFTPPLCHHRAAFPLIYIGLAVSISSCQWSKLTRLAKEQKVTVTPQVLAVHGQSATAEVMVQVPRDLAHADIAYSTEVFYKTRPEDERKPLAKLTFALGDVTYLNKVPTSIRTISIPYKPGQPNGTLFAQGVMTQGRARAKYLQAQPIAKGMITTMQLAIPEPALPTMPSSAADTSNTRSYTFYFDLNDATLKGYEGGAVGPLADFIAEQPDIQQVTITAYASPDPAEAGRTRIAELRGEKIKGFIISQIDKNTYQQESDKVKFDIKPEAESLILLDKQLNTSPLPDSVKRSIRATINGKGTYLQKLGKLQDHKHFEYLRSYIYPSLRTAHVKVKFLRPAKMKYEIALMANRIQKGTVDADKLSPTELSYAADLTPLPAEKEKLLLTATKLHKRGQDSYNLGTLYLELARKQYKSDARKRYLQQAIQRFKEAGSRLPVASVYYNLAVAYQLSSDVESAGQYYDLASRMGGATPLLQKIMSGKSGLHILAGEYDKAKEALKFAGSTYTVHINSGLLALNQEDYAAAETAFRDAVALDEKEGLAYYLIAVTGARSANDKLMYPALEQLARHERDLIPRAIEDLEFRNFRETEQFRTALK